MHRRTEKLDVIEANRRDIDIALELYTHIAQANELGIPPQLLEWYGKVIVTIWQSQGDIADRKTILRKHLEVYHQPLNRHRLEVEIIPSLESANLIATEQDPADRRRILYVPLREGPGYVPGACDTPLPANGTSTITYVGDISPPRIDGEKHEQTLDQPNLTLRKPTGDIEARPSSLQDKQDQLEGKMEQ